MSRRMVARSLAGTRLAWPDVFHEALAGLTQRPGRTVLTMIGTVLGVGAFVAVSGLAATGSHQISAEFSTLKATEVVVSDVGSGASSGTVYSFPRNADAVADALNGVVKAGRTWPIPGGDSYITTTLDPRAPRVLLSVRAASAGYLAAVGAVMAIGVGYNEFAESRQAHVAVLGSGVARQLGISSIDGQPTVFVHGTGYAVVGIMSSAARAPDASSRIFIPASTALAAYGKPDALDPATMLVHTRLGAADLVSRQVVVALRPDRPQLLKSVPPQNLFSIEGSVSGSLTALFLFLAVVTLAIGAVGIANTTLVAVFERTGEIGLRRALGARRVDVAAQILTETAALGLLGGLVGTTLGVIVVLCTAMAQSWTAVLDPIVTLSAPFIGGGVGILAGLYPGVRAARIEPTEALRR